MIRLYHRIFLINFCNKVIASGDILCASLLQTPIFISHGEKDEVLPIKNYYKATEYLKINKCNLESHVLEKDAHNISPEAITLFQKFIKKIL